MNMLWSDAASLIRHVIVVLVSFGVIKATNGQVDLISAALASIVVIAMAFLHSKHDRRRLLLTEPPQTEPVRHPTSSSRIGPQETTLPLLVAATTVLLVACAPNRGTVGPSLVEGSDGARELRNTAPTTVMVGDSNGEKLTATGPTSGGYILADQDQSRWFYSGGVPVNTFMRRGGDGSVTFSMGSGKDTVIEAAELTVDPATGAMKAKGLKLSSNASEPTRAQNEAWDRLTVYLQSLSAEQRQALEATLEAQIEATKVAAPVVSTAIQAVLTAIKGA